VLPTDLSDPFRKIEMPIIGTFMPSISMSVFFHPKMASFGNRIKIEMMLMLIKRPNFIGQQRIDLRVINRNSRAFTVFTSDWFS
jgi:hypothetical protein